MFVLCLSMLLFSCTNKDFQSKRVIQNFNFDWTFFKGGIDDAHTTDFDDSNWHRMDLPHDWSIEGPFSKKWASGTGYLPAGIGWYRKKFTLQQDDTNRKVYVYFGGIYNNSEVWINGNYLGKRPNGYISFQYDLTPYVKFGEANILAVKVDHTHFDDSRWYTGSGIYRDVQLIFTSPLHIKQWGVYAYSPKATIEKAILDIKTTVINEFDKSCQVTVENHLLYKDNIVSKNIVTIDIEAAAEKVISQSVKIKNPKLWNVDHPHLYSLITLIKDGDEVVDNLTTSIGFRNIQFDPKDGFFLNGKNMKLKGICMHHDAGCLGAAVPCKVIERRLNILKEMGCNAIRTSHNPFSTSFLDLCDRMGFLVINEAFDEWELPKKKWVHGWNVGEPSKQGYADDFEQWARIDLKDFILRDRNHPSVIMWSIGNEVDYPNDPYTHPILNTEANPQTWAKFKTDLPRADRLGVVAKELAAVIKKYDTTRPVTAGLASALISNETGYADALDIVGYNYQEFRYVNDHKNFPNRVLYGSENGMSLDAWMAVANNDYIMGQFLWTGFDYMGEAGRFPRRHSTSGVIDLAGHKKTEFYFRQSLWSDKPMVFIGTSIPESNEGSQGLWTHKRVYTHWNWKDSQTIRVKAFTNCETVDLSLNGKFLGSRKLADFPDRVLYWDIPFEEGSLKAIGKINGQEKASFEIKTAGEPAKLMAKSDVSHIKADRQDICHVFVTIVDEKDIPVYFANNKIICHVDGPIRLLGMEDANPRNTEEYKDNEQSAYHGNLLIYLQSLDKGGTATITVSAEGLESATIKMSVIDQF